ncbi:RecQ family ATP-dependent DNA helicase [Kribbella sp. CA-293567]|uniref:RecQ family ATP-dependent DNA helicase n=1 Tax=Kribbella sp. CA-293567 TaxID=3002436 RepID=UPI0022DD0466|nr:ATP-dependent DNA helicase RecQ [Kribbella sp. CA-293567]WBQ03483.1 ATP-dependent DNA helicase [Kribbella sp. CA-293567]
MRELLKTIARERFGWAELRPPQLEAMSAVMAGRDALVVMPTGAGKSAIFQVPALLLDGPAVIVSPLISLQHDQVVGLLDAGDGSLTARELNSTIGATERAEIYEALATGELRYLFLAPEQLAKTDVLDRLAETKPALFVVDEAHCVASWGHDFRPDYLRLGDAAEALGRPPVLALTATASRPVREEIAATLRLRDPLQVVAGFDRPNLSLEVLSSADAERRRELVLEQAAGEPGAGIVYTATRRETEEYAAALTERGRNAAPYHAGLKKTERSATHEAFLAGELEVVVATTAFGMGIDKPDIRFVVHASLADSLDSYYQEIGRAGRDGQPAKAILVHGPGDLGLRRFLAPTPPDESTVADVLAAVRTAEKPVLRSRLADRLELSRTLVGRCCALLEQAQAVRFDRRNRLRPVGESATAAADAVAVAEVACRVTQSRLDMMREYAETRGCRRQFLLSYFGDDLAEPCGNCDTCAAGLPEPATTRSSQYGLNERVRHHDFGEGSVLRAEDDRMVVLFDEFGYRTLSLDAVATNELLEPVTAPN